MSYNWPMHFDQFYSPQSLVRSLTWFACVILLISYCNLRVSRLSVWQYDASQLLILQSSFSWTVAHGDGYRKILTTFLFSFIMYFFLLCRVKILPKSDAGFTELGGSRVENFWSTRCSKRREDTVNWCGTIPNCLDWNLFHKNLPIYIFFSYYINTIINTFSLNHKFLKTRTVQFFASFSKRDNDVITIFQCANGLFVWRLKVLRASQYSGPRLLSR
jgi:hypothetical protein